MDSVHRPTDMAGPPWNTEKISLLISKFIERYLLGTDEVIHLRRRAILIRESIINTSSGDSNIFFTGSQVEGVSLLGSDNDLMFVDNHVVVLYPEQVVSPEDAHKTVLHVRESDCRPGYVALQLDHFGQKCSLCLINALVPVGNAVYVSSDMYIENLASERTTATGVRHESSGPSCSTGDMDYVRCFHFSGWPREANQWITRPRLYGWPAQALVDAIVQRGCHLVPVGDKCSEDTLLQWRLSFVSAERQLVHSFSPIQMKMYCLLKFFLKQMKDTLQDVIGKEDDDILCSYHLKTLLFISMEHSHPKLWQEQNLFYCFWFCFNILISCVGTGHFPSYFIPTTNMFQRKVHGQNQQKLFHLLNKFHSEKLLCLSHTSRTFSDISMLEFVCDDEMQTELNRTQTVVEMEYRRDMCIKQTLETLVVFPFDFCKPLLIASSINLYMKSVSDLDELAKFAATVHIVSTVTKKDVEEDMVAWPTNNKTRYRTLRRCQHRLSLCATMGTNLLDLATLHFLTGNYLKAKEMCGLITSQPSYFTHKLTILPEEQEEMYKQQYCGKGYTTMQKLMKTFSPGILIHTEIMHLPHLRLEIRRSQNGVTIPPLPYAAFLLFMSCHELKDKTGCDVALSNLLQISYDYIEEGRQYWIVYTLLGICYQTLGDYPSAIQAYWDSAQTKTDNHQFNPALERISALQRFDTQ